MFTTFEKYICHILWFGLAIHISILNYTEVYGNYEFSNFLKLGGHIEDTIFGLYKPTAKGSWYHNFQFFTNPRIIFVISIYLVISQFCLRKLHSELFILFNLIFSVILNFMFSSFQFFMLQWILIISFMLVGVFMNKYFVFLIGGICFYCLKDIHGLIEPSSKLIMFSTFSYLSMLLTRCISVGVTINNKRNMKDILACLFYYWYFPSILDGKLLCIKTFLRNTEVIYKVNPILILLNILKIYFILFLWNMFRNLVHFDLVFQYSETQNWHVIGYILLKGFQFYMFHYVNFQMGHYVAALDGFETAAGPRCIAYLSLFNDYLKWFDRGMYEWIQETVRDPIYNKFGRNKSFARFIMILICLSFILLYHGIVKENILFVIFIFFQLYINNFLLNCYKSGISKWCLHCSSYLLIKIKVIIYMVAYIMTILTFSVFIIEERFLMKLIHSTSYLSNLLVLFIFVFCQAELTVIYDKY